MGSSKGNRFTSTERTVMKVYAARDYIDITRRTDDTVEVNLPEYMPTQPQDNQYTDIVVQSNYFVNDNYPVTQDTIKALHYLKLPLMHGTICPVRFNKGAEFLLLYPTGKVEEGHLIFLHDKEKDETPATNASADVPSEDTSAQETEG